MGLSGYSSVHWPPGSGSVSIRWALMPSRPSSNTWNRPQGPAPIITVSVLMVTAHLLLNRAAVLRHYKGANDRACCTAEKAVTGYFLSPIWNKDTLALWRSRIQY